MASSKNELPVVIKAKEVKSVNKNKAPKSQENKQPLTPKVSGTGAKSKQEKPHYIEAEVMERKQPRTRTKAKENNLNVVASAITLILTLLSALVIIGWIWCFVYNERPTTTFTAQISKIGTDSEIYAMEFNQLRGNVGSGKKLNELKLNGYTDENLTTTFSSGIQVINIPKFKYHNLDSKLFTTKAVYERVFYDSTFKYYNLDSNNHSYVAIDDLTNDDYFIMEFDDVIYKFDFSNKKFASGRFLWQKQYDLVTPVMLFENMINTVNSLPTGDFVIDFPLTDYFNLSKFDVVEKQFNKLNVETQNKIRFEVKVHIEERGVVNANQSIFKNVNGNPNYAVDGIKIKDYWKTSAVLNLKNDNFKNDDGYLSLDKDLISYLRVYDDLEVYINLNVDSTIKGFNYYGLYGIPTKQIKLTSAVPQQFEIRNLALKDTGVSVQEIITNNVNCVEVLNG